jgi:hypothetical protein
MKIKLLTRCIAANDAPAPVLRPVFAQISLPLASCLLPTGVPGIEDLLACLAESRETTPVLQRAE